MSGMVTISTSAAPARFRSTRVMPVEGSWKDFAVSWWSEEDDSFVLSKVGNCRKGTCSSWIWSIRTSNE